MAKQSILSQKYTLAEWKQYEPALSSLTADTMSMAKAVLVDGFTPSELARSLGVSRQKVAQAAKRVNERLTEKQADKLVPLSIWVKENDIEKIKKLLFDNGVDLD